MEAPKGCMHSWQSWYVDDNGCVGCNDCESNAAAAARGTFVCATGTAGFNPSTCPEACPGHATCKAAYGAPATFTDAKGCRCASCGVEAGSVRDGRLVLLRILDAQQSGKQLYLCYWCWGQTKTWCG